MNTNFRRLVRSSLIVVFMVTAMAISFFNVASSVWLTSATWNSLSRMEFQMAFLMTVGVFVTASCAYLYGSMVPGMWRELRRPNISPVVPLARGD